MKKPGTGLRFADVLVIEEGAPAGQPPRVETFSFKSRDFSKLDQKMLNAQVVEDSREALHKYGETLDIRRDSLQFLLRSGRELPVRRVRLLYEGEDLKPMNKNFAAIAMKKVQEDVPGVEVSFQ